MINPPEDRILQRKPLQSGDVAAVIGADRASRPRLRRHLTWLLVAALAVALTLGVVWYRSPGAIDVRYEIGRAHV